MDEGRVWLLAVSGIVVLLILLQQRYSRRNLALILTGHLLFLGALFVGPQQPLSQQVVEMFICIAAAGAILLTAGILNQRHGRLRFPEGL